MTSERIGCPQCGSEASCICAAPTQVVVIFTDVGEEIDDEIALFFFFRKYASKYAKVHVVFTDGVKGSALIPADRQAKFTEWFQGVDLPENVGFHEAQDLSSLHGVTFAKMLQIAPLTGVSPEFFNKVKPIGHRYLMGSRSEPRTSMNMSQSWTESDEVFQQIFEKQEEALKDVPTTEISTTLSRNVPFTAAIINALPPRFRDAVMNKAYDQFVGRVPAHLPFCVNVTLGANLPTMKAYLTSGGYEDDYAKYYAETSGTNLAPMVKRVAEFVAATNATGDKVTQLQEGMMEIYKIVRFLTDGGDYTDSSFQVDAFEPSTARAIWVEKVTSANCTLTPAYDLLAMHVMEAGCPGKDCEPKALTQAMNKAYSEPPLEEHASFDE